MGRLLIPMIPVILSTFYSGADTARRTFTPVTFGAVFSLLHGYLIYATYTGKPHEFGYLGLVFVPFLEALIGVPISLLIVFLIGRLQLR
jgi:hypothetical protein